MSRSVGACPVHPLGPIAVATLVSHWRGTLRLTVVAKTTFAFAPDAEMSLVAPRDVVQSDVHFDDERMRSLEAGADLIPHLESAEVVFQGHAHAPGGQATPRMLVRLGLAGDRGLVLDKCLVVVGDRDEATSAPQPFVKMRIGYERTVGGPGNPENPIGVGYTGGFPNVEYADAARASRPAALGPLAAYWPCRASLLKGREPFVFGDAPVTLPDDLDWRYFQSAPPDQRVPEIPDRAWILLDGLHPEHAALRTRLPQLRVSARIYFADRADTPIELRADTLSIDGPAQRCTLTWRASFPLATAAVLADVVVVAAGAHAPGKPLGWPVIPKRPVAAQPLPAPTPMPGPAAPTPGAPQAPPASVGAPQTPPGLPTVKRAPAHLVGTAPVSPDVHQRFVTPFRAVAKGTKGGLGTAELPAFAGEPQSTRVPLPFAGGSSASSAPTSVRLDTPGAPWALAPAPLVPPLEEHQVMTAMMLTPRPAREAASTVIGQGPLKQSPPAMVVPAMVPPPSVQPPPVVEVPPRIEPDRSERLPVISAPPLEATPPLAAPEPPPASVARPSVPRAQVIQPPVPTVLARPGAPMRVVSPAPSLWREPPPQPAEPPAAPLVPTPPPEPEEDLYGDFAPRH